MIGLNVLVGTAVLAVLAVIYFAPGIIAGLRCHRNANAIFVLNILAGWTVIGWIVAMVWAWTNQERRP